MDNELTSDEKLEAFRKSMDEKLEASGATAEVDPDFYREFIETSDPEMAGMIRLIIYDRADEFNGLIDKGDFNQERLINNVSSMLFMIAIGRCFFSEEDFRCCIVKPVGPPPTDEERSAIDARITDAHTLIKQTFQDILNESKEQEAE